MFKLGFDKVQEWTNPHPPGTFPNCARDGTGAAADDCTVGLRFPGGGSAAPMKLRGMQLPSTRFWTEWGRVDPKSGSVEGRLCVIDAPGGRGHWPGDRRGRGRPAGCGR